MLMVLLDEDRVRQIVEEAIRIARTTTPENVSDAAVVQRALDERFIDGHWRSTYFLDKEFGYVNGRKIA